MEKVFCVISHTHWDREWYMPFEKFRIKLVDLIDNLLDILEEYPHYIFHLDAQTIVLEDYLEIKPWRRDVLKKHIKQGSILVGPWYVQNDFYLTSGEATVRNLLTGTGLANEMGKCERIGYVPDQFGLMSSLPQILKGFGIDNCIFGRGYADAIFWNKPVDEFKKIAPPSEFIWEGSDGSKVLAVHMSYWYNNAQRFSEDLSKSVSLLKMIENNFEGIALTPYLLLMNGVDHLEAQENLLPILEKLNAGLPEGKKIEQTTMHEYIDRLKAFFKIDSAENPNNSVLTVYKGELRNGLDSDVLQGTLSSRIYLKIANTRAQNLLENRLEPLYSFIRIMGADERYPQGFLNYLWKLIMQNHPHDSICGCSRDEVHNHMEDRYERIFETGEELLRRGMDFISAHVSREGIPENHYLINIFNSVESQRCGVVEIEAQFPVEENVKGFDICDKDGNSVTFEMISYERTYRNLFSPINLPGVMEVDSFKARLFVENIPALGYRTYILKPLYNEIKTIDLMNCQNSGNISLENECLLAEIDENGSINLKYKDTGKVYRDVLVLEDTEDCGDSYVFCKSENGMTYTTKGVKPVIQCLCKTEMLTRYLLTYDLDLPEYYDRIKGKRSENLVKNRIEVAISLEKGCKWLELNFRIENRSKDHRIRALVKTGISSDFTAALAPFDVITRDRNDVRKSIQNGDQPNSGFVDIFGGLEGITVLNEGLHEYKHQSGDDGIIALTLLRANGLIERYSNGETWKAPGNQCLRTIKCEMALYPHKGNYVEANCAGVLKEFQNKLLTYTQPVDIRKFAGGRPAVQDSQIKEIFFQKDKYEYLRLPLENSFLRIIGDGVVLSALKKAENNDYLIIRVFNTKDEDTDIVVEFCDNFSFAGVADLGENIVKELAVKENIVALSLKSREILTIAIK